MSFGAGTLWDVRASGDDSANGGGFDLLNANFPTDLTATSANTSAPVVSSASYSFVAADVGAWVYIKAGTNWTPGLYQISIVAGGAATLAAGVGLAVLVANGIPGGMNTAAGCATVAAPTAGTFGVDYSQNGPVITFTDMVIDGTTNTKFTSVLKPVSKNYIGNVISVTSGTGFTVQRVQVVSTVTTTATCDKSLGTLSSTGGHGGLGGSLATPGMAGLLHVGSNGIAICNSGAPTVYTMSATQNVAGGGILQQIGAQAAPTYCFGWATNRHLYNTDTRPQFKPGANSTTLFSTGSSSSYCQINNIDCANPSAFTGCTAFFCQGNFGRLMRCKSADINTAFAIPGGSFRFVLCWADNAPGASFGATGSQHVFYACVATRGSATMGSATGTNNHYIWCVSTAPKSGADAFIVTDSATLCIADGSTGSSNGFIVNGAIATLTNCLATNNAVQGFTGGTMSYTQRLINCAGYNNTTSDSDPTKYSPLVNIQGGLTHLTGDPYTNRAGLNFTINNTAGAGALLRALGFPSSLPGLTGTAYPDIGVYQSAAAVLAQAATGDVRSGTSYASGTLSGTLAVPIPGDVETGVATDATTGTFAVPTAGQVASGVGYGAAGTEFAGTLAAGGGGGGIIQG